MGLFRQEYYWSGVPLPSPSTVYQMLWQVWELHEDRISASFCFVSTQSLTQCPKEGENTKTYECMCEWIDSMEEARQRVGDRVWISQGLGHRRQWKDPWRWLLKTEEFADVSQVRRGMGRMEMEEQKHAWEQRELRCQWQASESLFRFVWDTQKCESANIQKTRKTRCRGVATVRDRAQGIFRSQITALKLRIVNPTPKAAERSSIGFKQGNIMNHFSWLEKLWPLFPNPL